MDQTVMSRLACVSTLLSPSISTQAARLPGCQDGRQLHCTVLTTPYNGPQMGMGPAFFQEGVDELAMDRG